ncbi:MAG: MFS transporter [Desulfobacterales bacterium]|jgi:MFS family permease
MQIGASATVAITNAADFLRRQQRDWYVTVTRSSLERFVYQMVVPYLSIYTIALGASATQLGLVNSLGMGIAGLLSLLSGWLIDRIGTKKIYLIGITMLAISYLTYGLATNWTIIIIAMMAYWLGFTNSVHSCATVCANSLANQDRATGMSICETFAAGLLGMAGPIMGALMVTEFGGVNVRGIRPLFFVGLAITIVTFLLIYTQLSDRKWTNQSVARGSLFKGFSQVFKEGRNLKRWLIISSVTSLPLGMVLPFCQVFAHDFKGADQYILGYMVTGFALTPLVFGIPFGRLADKIGRKKVIYLIAPLFWVSNLTLIWAPSPGFLIAAGILQGFYFVSMIVTGAMTFELVPAEQMGRWLGIIRFVRLLLSAGSAYAAGIIWDNLGPQYVFLTIIGLDLFIRIPLLRGMPETLGLQIENARRD